MFGRRFDSEDTHNEDRVSGTLPSGTALWRSGVVQSFCCTTQSASARRTGQFLPGSYCIFKASGVPCPDSAFTNCALVTDDEVGHAGATLMHGWASLCVMRWMRAADHDAMACAGRITTTSMQ